MIMNMVAIVLFVAALAFLCWGFSMRGLARYGMLLLVGGFLFGGLSVEHIIGV